MCIKYESEIKTLEGIMEELETMLLEVRSTKDKEIESLKESNKETLEVRNYYLYKY